MMNKNVDVLSDIEADISGNWGDIHKNIQEKKQAKKQKEIIKELGENPRRMDFPNFSKFYEIMFRLCTTGSEYEMKNLRDYLREIMFKNSNEKMPLAFDHIWNAFCNPREYQCETGIYCQYCKNRWDIFCKRMRMMPINITHSGDYSNVNELSVLRVNCPTCNNSIASLATDEIFGIFKHIHVDEAEEYKGEYRRENVREKFRGYF